MSKVKIQIKIKKDCAVPVLTLQPSVAVDQPQLIPVGYKHCNTCGQTKPSTEFYKRVNNKCSNCLKTEQRARNAKNKEKELEIRNDPTLRSKPKFCDGCQQMKTAGDFRINRGECLDCERKYGRKYNQEHLDVRQQYWQENLDHVHRLQADWYQRNKPHIQAKYNERYANDPEFRQHRDHNRLIQKQLGSVETPNDYIGSSFEQMANWLEYNFTSKMTWQNRGIEWDVDHVIPVSKWDLSNPEQTYMCYNWKNLSPLNSPKNRIEKNNMIDHDQIVQHKAQLRKYYLEKSLDLKELESYLIKYEQQLISLGETP